MIKSHLYPQNLSSEGGGTCSIGKNCLKYPLTGYQGGSLCLNYPSTSTQSSFGVSKQEINSLVEAVAMFVLHSVYLL